jgi:hypothetical protein
VSRNAPSRFPNGVRTASTMTGSFIGRNYTTIYLFLSPVRVEATELGTDWVFIG